MEAVARKKFIDKYTGEKYEAGELLELEPERYKEIRETDPDLVIAVADEQSVADQSTVEDAETEDGKTEPGAAGQSTTEDGTAGDDGTADGKKKPKKKTEKSAE